MKSQFKRFSKSSISVLLSLCMLITCVSAGIITTDAAKIDTGAASDAAVGAAVQDDDSVGRGAGYVLYGTNDDPSSWTDTGANVNNSGTMYTASIPKSKFTSSGANYFIGLSSSTSPSNMFFQSSDITVKANGAWFSGYGSQSRDRYRYARISFGTVPTSDIQLQVDTSNNTYTFSYTDSETTYGVTVQAETGGQVVAGGVTINAGGSTTVSVGSSPVTVTATAKTGYQFSGWTTTGSVTISSTTNSTATITATGTGTVKANFTDITTTRRIYFDNSKVGWSQPYAYAFDANQVVYSAYWPGTKMTLYKGKVWYIDVSTAATKIIFSSGSNTAQTPNLTIPASGTYTMPTFYGFTGTSGTGSWSNYTESTSTNVKSATLDASITGNSKLYTNINATFYDYYTEHEYNNGYLSITNDEGWVNGVPSNNYYRNPYKQFNQSLSEYAQKNNVALPMYYLAEYYQGSSDGSAWYHGQGYYNESLKDTQNGIGKYINDSNQLGDNHKAVTGLSGTKLENGTIHHYSSSGANQNGAPMAMFDEEWLTSRTQGTAAANNNNYSYDGTLATIVNSKFPVTKTKYDANTYDKVYLDIGSQTWWSGTAGVKIMAHLYNSTSDYLDVEMDHDGGNIYSVESTGYSYVVFYRYGWENGNLMWINQTPNLTIPASNNRYRRYYPNAQRAYDGRNNAMCYYSGGDTKWLDHSSAHYMEGGQVYYQFNSTGGRDNIWFTNLTATDGTQPKLFYGAGKNNATKNGYNGLYSFMPFDHGGTGRDMGFGMKLEIDFTLGPDGQLVDPNDSTHYIDQVFNFSGDDDLWVYVDDQLVLDLGGAHAKTDGSINFHTKQATATPAASTVVNSASRNGTFTLADKEVHKMTIFYTERGLHESNLKFGFNFAPVDTDLKVNKVVSPANVNGTIDSSTTSGYAEGSLAIDAITAAANDVFTVNHYYGDTKAAAEAKTSNIGAGVKYTLTNKNNVQTAKTTDDGGTYPIKNRETAQFANVLHKKTYLNKYFDLQETFADNNVYNYTPDFVVRDRDNGEKLPSFVEAADGSGGSFLFNNYAQSAVDNDMTPVHLDATFTNAIKTHTLILSKNVLDNLGDKTAPYDQFRFKVEVDVDGEKNAFNYKTYALNYFGDVVGTTDETGANAGVVTLENEQIAIITGIPEKARVKVTEVGMGAQYKFYGADVSGGTKGGDVNNGVWVTMNADTDIEIQNLVWTYEFIYHYPSRLVYYQNDWAPGKWSDGENQDADDIRLWGDEMEYTVDGILDDNFYSYLSEYPIEDGIVKFLMPDEILTSTQVSIDDIVELYGPYVDNFKETIAWDTKQIVDYGKYDSPNHHERDSDPSRTYPKKWSSGAATSHPITIETSEENAEVTVHVYADVTPDFDVDVDFMLPFNYTSSSSGMNYTYNSDTQHSVSYNALLKTMSGTTRFQNRYVLGNQDGSEVFVEAPDCVKMSNGTYKYFYYWKVYKRGEQPSKATMESTDANVFRKCYNKKFNLACYEDYTIFPYYGQDAHISSQMAQNADRADAQFANITWLENSRNQWNYYGGGKVGDEHHENDAANTSKWQNYGDRLFNDFVIEYGYNNKLIKDMASNIKTGIVIERVQQLVLDPRDPDGDTLLADANNAAYDSAKTNDGIAAVKTFVSSNFTERSGKALLYSPFDYKELDNKNMIEQFYSFANYYQYGTKTGLDWEVATDKTTLRNYLYRAYAYIQVDSNEPIVSVPVYYTIYDEATAGHVTDPIYVG